MNSKADLLAVELRQIAALLQHGSLEPVGGVANVDDKPEEGIVIVGVNLVLRRAEFERLEALDAWDPREEDFMVDVYTRREWRQRRTKANWSYFFLWFLFTVIAELVLWIAKLKGWL